MPPARWLKRPAWAKPYAMAMEPTAVTIQDSREMPPTCAMLAGNMMIPEPIMFTATRNVSCIRLIRFFCMTFPFALPELLPGQTIHQIATALGRRLKAQPMNVSLETRKLLVELAGVEQVVLNRLGLLR